MIGCEKIQIKTSYFPPLSFDKDLKKSTPNSHTEYSVILSSGKMHLF